VAPVDAVTNYDDSHRFACAGAANFACRAKRPKLGRSDGSAERSERTADGNGDWVDRAQIVHSLFRSGEKREEPPLPDGSLIWKLLAVPTGFEPAISSLTGTYARPLHHGTPPPGTTGNGGAQREEVIRFLLSGSVERSTPFRLRESGG
jgi:hypothetical protein